MKRTWIVFALLAVASVSLVEGRGRAPLMVPAQFGTIQAAVDAAEPGDVILVAPGRYCEQVVITKSDLTIRQVNVGEARRPIVTGDCLSLQTESAGFKVAGSLASPVTNVAISGFVVEGFETGILLQYVVRSRVTSNEVRDNTRSTKPNRQNGIWLLGSSFNRVSGNFAHGNGHMGIGLGAASHGNVVSHNQLVDNQATYVGTCTLMVSGNSVGNQIVDNEVRDTVGVGIMVGASPTSLATQTLVAGNRVRGHEWAGIWVGAGSQANLILRNDATGNNTLGEEYDLLDLNTPSTNLWLGNTGTCSSQGGC